MNWRCTMKKRIYLALLSLVLVFAATGCGDKKEEEKTVSVQEDLVEFVNDELPAIETYRSTAVNSYNAYFVSEDIDTAVFLSDLQSTMIPNMETYITELTAVEVATEDVAALKDLYLQAAEKQCEAMRQVATAISEQDPQYLEQADTLIEEAQSLITQYESQLKILAIDNDVQINGSFE